MSCRASNSNLQRHAFRRSLALLLAAAPLTAHAQESAAAAKAVAGNSAHGTDASPPEKLGSVVVSATRTPQAADRVAATARVLAADEIVALPAATLDSTLRSDPSFGLFRRADSLTAHPTTQGVSLRGLGPSGASRSLVLLDGIPLNDPFGGWVTWSQLPRDFVGRIEIVPGGGASAWGNAALGGVIHVLTAAPTALAGVTSLQTTLLAGDFGTRSGSVLFNGSLRQSQVQLAVEDFSTHGFRIIAPEDRGRVDVPAWSRHRSSLLRLRLPVGRRASLSASVRGFEEKRGNGTPYQRNATRSTQGSVELAMQPNDGFAWTALGYVQSQRFASTFGAIDATRSTETPASDQFAVPATATGASWTGVWTGSDAAKTSLGADLRHVSGETRENYSYSSGTYTRQRFAGGTQEFAGVFATREQPVSNALRITIALRADAWTDEDGHRRETDRASGAVLRDDRFAARNGVELSPSAGVVWHAAPGWRVHGNTQRSFRRPTLNELYRPFRQGANVTEANPLLRTERVTSAEVGLEFAPALPRSLPASAPPLTLGATLFWNELDHAVSNVTVARGPGVFPLFGTLPAGGIGRQRLNLDEIRVQGIELSARWRPVDSLSVAAGCLYNDATVRRAAVSPALAGNRLAEVPRQSATVSATWVGPGRLSLSPRLRWIGRQFDDDENTLILGETVIVDLGLSLPVRRHVDGFITIENLTDTRIETARSATGVISTGTPRIALAGLRGKW